MLDTYSVGSELPFHSTLERETKSVPVTVNMKLLIPTSTALGFRPVSEGTGFESRGWDNYLPVLRMELDELKFDLLFSASSRDRSVFGADQVFLTGIM